MPGSTSGPRAPAPTTTGPTFVPVPEIAARLGIIVTRVHQLLRDRTLVAVRRDGVLQIPEEFIADATQTDPVGVVKGLTGTITLLTDARFSDDEIIEWLFDADDSLPGSPIQALRENRGREVHRRAQVAGF